MHHQKPPFSEETESTFFCIKLFTPAKLRKQASPPPLKSLVLSCNYLSDIEEYSTS